MSHGATQAPQVPTTRGPGRPRGGARARRAEPVTPASVARLPGGRRTPLRPLLVWSVLTVLAVAVLVVARAGVGLPDDLVTTASRVAAVVLTTAYAVALAHRAQGRPVAAGVVVVVLAGAAQVSGEAVLLSGVATLTAAVAGSLAVAVTEPATGMLAAAREALLALVVAAGGALGVAAYDGSPDPVRLRLVALAVALVGLLVLADHLGSGLAGLGRAARIALVVALVVAVGAVAYGEALGRWGSVGLIDAVADARRTVQDLAYAVPVPLAALLGVPALVYGAWLRGRARQGWWVSAFGVGATVPVAVALSDPRLGLERASLGLAYSAVIGLVVGLLVVALDRRLTHG